MGCEIKITLKDSFKTATFKQLSDSNVMACYTDDTIDQMLDRCTKEFGSQPTKTTVNIRVFE